MIPPTSIDGTDITGATIDGTDVTEITVDGDTVFTAGPSLPTTHLVHRYDADAITGLSDGDDVTTWQDSQGSNDITAPSGREPTFEANVQNALPVVRFSGNQLLNGGSGLVGQPDHLITVYKRDAAAGNDRMTVLDSNDPSLTNRHNVYSEDNPDEFAFFASSANILGSAINSDFNIHTILADGFNSEYRINGVVEGTGNPGSDPLQGVQIGAQSNDIRHLDGDVCELLVYNDELTAQEVADAEAFLSNKWGISI